MSSSPALTLLAAVAAGTVAAVGTTTMLADSAPVETGQVAPALAAVETLRDEVRRLADQQAALGNQVMALDLRLSTAPSVETSMSEAQPLAGTAPELVELRQQVAQLSARLEGGDGAEPMAMETVSAALTRIREEEDAERQQARAEARREREADRLVELTEALTLDGFQQEKMGELIATYGASSDTIIESARQTSDWGGLRDEYATLHGEMDESLVVFLTPSQLEELEELGGARALSSSGWGSWGRSSSKSDSSDG